MNIVRSIIMSFSMFSCIITPRVEWKKENMGTALAFLPLIGCVIGLVMWGFALLCKALTLNNFVFAAVMTLIPVIISGGIHIDGFCDTVDALASHAEVERKHEILKDSHIGTFAVLWLIAYFLLAFSLYASQTGDGSEIYIYCMIPVFSRIASAFASIHFKKYGKNGLLQTFSESAKKGISTFIVAAFFVIFTVLALFLNISAALFMLFALVICLVYVFFMSRKQFGGMSGDISGFLLVISELAMLFSSFLAQRIF